MQRCRRIVRWRQTFLPPSFHARRPSWPDVTGTSCPCPTTGPSPLWNCQGFPRQCSPCAEGGGFCPDLLSTSTQQAFLHLHVQGDQDVLYIHHLRYIHHGCHHFYLRIYATFLSRDNFFEMAYFALFADLWDAVSEGIASIETMV